MPYTLDDIKKKMEQDAKMNQKSGDNSLLIQVKNNSAEKPIKKEVKQRVEKEVQPQKKEQEDKFTIYIKRAALVIGLVLVTILLTSLLVKLISVMFQ